MIAKMGQDGHDRGAKVVATGYADMGLMWIWDLCSKHLPKLQNKLLKTMCMFLGVSSLAAGHKTLGSSGNRRTEKTRPGRYNGYCGGVIPPQDYDYLYKAGDSG
jgi:methylmalonyl-CoA mutase